MSASGTELRHLVEPVDTWSPAKDAPDDPFVYVDLSSVDRELKEITAPQGMTGAEAPSRARQLLKSGDVLVSTVRPNLNAVAHVPDELDGATGSTGFCVLRADPEDLDSRYLFHWTRSSGFVASMVQRATGASYPAVSDRIVKESKIPLPSLPEQRRIAVILDKADVIRRKRQQTLDLADQFLRSAFLDLFGDPVTNPKGWPSGGVEDIVSSPREDIRCGPFGTQLKVKEIVSEGVPLLGIENVRGNQFRPSTDKFLTQEKAQDLKRFNVQEGDVLVTRMGTIGHSCVVPAGFPEARITYHLFRIRVNRSKCLPGFLAATITRSGTFMRQLERTAHGAIMSGLKTSDLKEVRFLLPPLPIQERYTNLVLRVDALTMQATRHATQCNLSNSLTQRAFRGDM